MENLLDFIATGQNQSALFTLKIFRGQSMALLGMNWREGEPPVDFVGFAIEYQPPGSAVFFALKNRLSFLTNTGNINPNMLSSRLSPIQKFRWVHFLGQLSATGAYTYRVTPVFMDEAEVLSYGDFQQAQIQFQPETYPDQLTVGFTRGFIESQAFVDRFGQGDEAANAFFPKTAKQGLTFVSTNPKESVALAWMGFEARATILDLLDKAIEDNSAQVRVTAYDLNEPEVVDRLIKLAGRLKIIIDNSGSHGDADSAETQAETKLNASAGVHQVQRQKMGNLQHNKTIAVQGDQLQAVICGSTNFSWRAFYVQNNNTIRLYGKEPVQLFMTAFDNLWNHPNDPQGFSETQSANWNDLQLAGINAKIAFSPHNATNALLEKIADDIGQGTTSSLLYSLAFLYETPGPILEAIKQVTGNNALLVYGISDRQVGDLALQKPDGNPPTVYPKALVEDVPGPFKAEVTGGAGINMHHKFVVIDFDKPSARVYMGSYNFSSVADLQNGENLLLLADQRIATAYMIEAVTIFDHYEFRDAQVQASASGKPLSLKTPPAPSSTDLPWWDKYYTNAQRIHDRILFS